jgi:formylglycine-generating enzyme required for sulfatase activity
MIMKRKFLFAWIMVFGTAVLSFDGCGLYDALYDDQTNNDTTKVPHVKFAHKQQMVSVPARDSSFIMGDSSQQEAPLHKVKFTHDYWMDKAEVTRGDFDSVMSAVLKSKYKTGQWSSQLGSGNNLPVTGRTWYDAILYCNARSIWDSLPDTVYTYDTLIGSMGDSCYLGGVVADFQKKGYRLPTEAEWEYACRAGTKNEFHWKPGEDALTFAWISDNSQSVLHPGQKKNPNAYGLYDMMGNAWEWCFDYFGYYNVNDTIDPVTQAVVPGNTLKRVLRGGSISQPLQNIGSGRRFLDYPSNGAITYGFRVVVPEGSF